MEKRTLALVPLVVALAPAAPAAAPPPPALFILPVRADPWHGFNDPRLLEERIATALGRGHRVRALGPRDVPPRARRELPADLGACTTPACLVALGRATGAQRLLGLEILDEGGRPVLFATLYDASDGGVAGRRELPRPASAWASASRTWSEEVARWILGAPPPPPPPALDAEPRLGLELAPAQRGRPEARALVSQLSALLQGAGVPRLVPPGDAGARAGRTHLAVLTVDDVAVSERVHHVHRYRHGVLVASLVVSDVRTGQPIWSRRESAEVSARSDDSSNQGVVDAVVGQVAARLAVDLQESSLDALMKGDP
jgi:hypothetical protein